MYFTHAHLVVQERSEVRGYIFIGGGVREADLQKMVEEMVGSALEAQRAERTRVQLTPGRT